VTAGLATIEANATVCVTSPRTCDPTTVAAESSPSLARFRTTIEGYVRDGIEVRSIGGVYYVVESVRLGADGQHATIGLCYVDGDVLIDPGSSPDPSDDIVIDDAVNSRRLEADLVRTANGWRRWDARVSDEWLGENRCPVR
jgi:hypothetical protein